MVDPTYPKELRDAVWQGARAGDRDRYWAALFVPEPARTGLMTLTAVNVELARISEIISEPMMGEIRLQWWRDALAGNTDTGNLIADALRLTVRKFQLDRPRLQGLIDARIFDVAGDIMPDQQAAHAYLNKTAGSMFALACKIVSGETLRPDAAAQDSGLAYGLTGLMRSLAYHRARGRLYLPATAFVDQGVSPEAFMEGGAEESCAKALVRLRADARQALANARPAIGNLAPASRIAFLPLVLVEPALKSMDRASPHSLQSDEQTLPALSRLWHLTLAALRGPI